MCFDVDHVAIFFTNCRYIYPVYAGRLAWRIGLDAFQHRVGFGSPWCDAEDIGGAVAPYDLDWPLSGNGVVDGHSDPAALVESAIVGHSLAVGGRHRIHDWSGILCG